MVCISAIHVSVLSSSNTQGLGQDVTLAPIPNKFCPTLIVQINC